MEPLVVSLEPSPHNSKYSVSDLSECYAFKCGNYLFSHVDLDALEDGKSARAQRNNMGGISSQLFLDHPRFSDRSPLYMKKILNVEDVLFAASLGCKVIVKFIDSDIQIRIDFANLPSITLLAADDVDNYLNGEDEVGGDAN